MASELAQTEPSQKAQELGLGGQKAGVEGMAGARLWHVVSGEFEGLASEGVQGVKSPRDGTTDAQVGNHLIRRCVQLCLWPVMHQACGQPRGTQQAGWSPQLVDPSLLAFALGSDRGAP